LKNNTKELNGRLVRIFITHQKNWVVCLSNQILGFFLWISIQKSLDKLVSDFYIYLEFGEKVFKQVVIALNQSVNKNTKIRLGKYNPKTNLSSKKCIAYEKQLLV